MVASPTESVKPSTRDVKTFEDRMQHLIHDVPVVESSSVARAEEQALRILLPVIKRVQLQVIGQL